MDTDLLSLLVRFLLAGIFLSAGTIKLIQLEAWRQSLSQYGLPQIWFDLAKYMIPATEISIGVGMLLSTWVWACYFALVLLSIFTSVIVKNQLQRRQQACGCFGQFWSTENSMVMISRNLLLMAAAASLAVWS